MNHPKSELVLRNRQRTRPVNLWRIETLARDLLARSFPRRHAASVVAAWRLSSQWEIAATARAYSGFPRTPVLGLRVAADETEDGRLLPALDAEGRYVYETDSGDGSNLNTARLPALFRLDLLVSWKPRGDAGRWLFYLDVINAPTARTRARSRRASTTTPLRRSTSPGCCSSGRPRSRSCPRSGCASASERAATRVDGHGPGPRMAQRDCIGRAARGRSAMDPLTQGLLGASFGQALCGPSLGRRAPAFGALVGMSPDLDVLANPTGPLAE